MSWSFHKIGCACGAKADKNGPGCHTEAQPCVGCVDKTLPCIVDREKNPTTWWMHQAMSIRNKYAL